MIQTSITKVKVNEIIQSQIPEVVDTDNPRFGEFMKQYYLSQEFKGKKFLGYNDFIENKVSILQEDFDFLILPG